MEKGMLRDRTNTVNYYPPQPLTVTEGKATTKKKRKVDDLFEWTEALEMTLLRAVKKCGRKWERVRKTLPVDAGGRELSEWRTLKKRFDDILVKRKEFALQVLTEEEIDAMIGATGWSGVKKEDDVNLEPPVVTMAPPDAPPCRNDKLATYEQALEAAHKAHDAVDAKRVTLARKLRAARDTEVDLENRLATAASDRALAVAALEKKLNSYKKKLKALKAASSTPGAPKEGGDDATALRAQVTALQEENDRLTASFRAERANFFTMLADAYKDLPSTCVSPPENVRLAPPPVLSSLSSATADDDAGESAGAPTTDCFVTKKKKRKLSRHRRAESSSLSE